jgi:hypothetical protein
VTRKICIGLALLAACGKGDDKQGEATNSKSRAADGGAPAARELFTKRPTLPPATPVCEKAREVLGAWAECVETELAELATPAGKVFRVEAKGDPTRTLLYVLQKPSGEVTRGEPRVIFDEIVKAIDVAATPPEQLAKLIAELHTGAAVARCLPGTNDTLPEGKPCDPPAFVGEGDARRFVVTIEEFPDPRLNRDRYAIYKNKFKVAPGELSHDQGEGVARSETPPPRPANLPALPDMSTPPAWNAKPEKAPADVSAALCADASLGEGARCEAWAYPTLKLPTGELFFLSNDRGRRFLWGVRKPDGTIMTGYKAETESKLIADLVPTYDAKVVPPETFVAAYLTFHGVAAKIRCLPGSGDVLPEDVPCKPPTPTKQGENLVIETIVEELPYPQALFSPSEHAIRRRAYEFTPGGGVSSDGMRLVDLEDK